MAKKMPSDAHIRREAELEGESFEHEREEYEHGAAKPKKHVRADGGKTRRRLDRPARRQAGGAVGMPMGQPMPGAAPGGMPGGAPPPQLSPQQMQMLQARRAQMMQGQGMPQGPVGAMPGAGMRPPGMARGGSPEKWIQGTGVDKPGHKGRLHRALHVPEGEPIPAKKLSKALHSGDSHLQHMAQFAKNVKR